MKPKTKKVMIATKFKQVLEPELNNLKLSERARTLMMLGEYDKAIVLVRLITSRLTALKLESLIKQHRLLNNRANELLTEEGAS